MINKLLYFLSPINILILKIINNNKQNTQAMFQTTQHCIIPTYTNHNYINSISFSTLPFKSTSPCKYILNYVIDYDYALGKGNFSSVYRCCKQAQPTKYYAVKLLNINTLRMQKIEHLAKAQIQILRSINHKNVISCRDVYWDQNWYYIFTDFFDGNLEEFIKKGRSINQVQVLNYIKDIFDGLMYLQKNKIVHRDIKPANIFLKDGKAVVADLGFAKYFNQPFYDLQIGSPPYMAPQGITINFYNAKTDVWAFGAMLYQIFHGQNPFLRCMDMNQLIKKIYTPISLVSLRLDLTIEMKQMIISCLEIDYSKRPRFSEIESSWYYKKIFHNNKSDRLKQLLRSDIYSTLRSCASEQNLLSVSKVEKVSKQQHKLTRCNTFNRLTKLKSDIKKKKDQNKALIIMSPCNSSKIHQKQTDLYPNTQTELLEYDYYGYQKSSVRQKNPQNQQYSQQMKERKSRKSVSEQKLTPLKETNKSKTKIQDLKIKNSHFLNYQQSMKKQKAQHELNIQKILKDTQKSPINLNKTSQKLLGRYYNSPNIHQNQNLNSNLNLSPYNCRRNYKINIINQNHIKGNVALF